MTRPCVTCGAPLAGRGRRLYCSPICAMVERKCAHCGLVERVPFKRRGRPYCSQRCAKAGEGLKARVERVQRCCQFCGVTFLLHPSRATPRRKYCSKTCAALGRPINGRPSAIASEAIALFLASFNGAAETEKRVGRWSIDLALPATRLAVELDGEYWHSLPEMVAKDERKVAALRSLGWRPISIPIRRDSTPETLAAAISYVAVAFAA